MIYPDVDNAIHSHLGVGEERGGRTAIHLPLWSDVGGSGGGTGAGLAAAVSGNKVKSIDFRKLIVSFRRTLVSIFINISLVYE